MKPVHSGVLSGPERGRDPSQAETPRGRRDELDQWAIEPCELHRVYPPLTDDTATGNGTEERGVTGGETALAEANTRATKPASLRRYSCELAVGMTKTRRLMAQSLP